MKRRLAVVLTSLVTVFLALDGIEARNLSIEERIQAQRALDRVAYMHQIGVRRPFEEVVTAQALDRKVREYLKQSVALKLFWNTEVSSTALRSEVERMATQTRLPERLGEIFEALGNHSFMVQECLARPALVDRMSRNFFAFDRDIHLSARMEAEQFRSQLVDGILNAHSDHPARSLYEISVAESESPPDPTASPSEWPLDGMHTPIRFEVSPEEFDVWRSRVPEEVGEIGPLEEVRESFRISVVLQEGQDSFHFARFEIPKRGWSEWWQEVQGELDVTTVNAVAEENGILPIPEGTGTFGNHAHPDAESAVGGTSQISLSGCVNDSWDNGSLDDVPKSRQDHTAVWTGSVMIVWGGLSRSAQYLDSGGRYDPATDTWSSTALMGAPEARRLHTAVWTGERMLIWGGHAFNGQLNSGAAYDPGADSWSSIQSFGAPTSRLSHVAVWTGEEMIIWGGASPIDTKTGGRYDPLTDSWTPTSTLDAPAGRRDAAVVWTGTEMIVWGGTRFDPQTSSLVSVGTGGRYDPMDDQWLPLTDVGAPAPRSNHTVVWTGSRMIVWGGSDDGVPFGLGASYDPIADAWSPVPPDNAPEARDRHTAVWSGNEMIIWGGFDGSTTLATGAHFDPLKNEWRPTETNNAPPPHYRHTAVWTGELMLVWGGTTTNPGGRYDPITNSWTPMTIGDAPGDISLPRVVWTGSEMVIWGSADRNSRTLTGRYNPVTDSWRAISDVDAPSPRGEHTVVWAGGELIIWGGNYFGGYLDTGGRYDPINDVWTPTSTEGAPSPRRNHTAVWTGERMIVWGGMLGFWSETLRDGALYDPAADSWVPISTTDSPSGRSDQTAVWTGRQMIVWGGYNGTVHLGDGRRYDPATDQWSPMTLVGAPSGRSGHSAVWMGEKMIIWGGVSSNFLRSGGLYDPGFDSWIPTSITSAPWEREDHGAVWTGDEMVVWGGRTPLNRTGTPAGRYDPATNRWTAISTVNEPTKRWAHAAVWSGNQMVIWGGTDGFGALRDGGRYCGCLGDAERYFQDHDGDGFGDPSVQVPSCDQPHGFVPIAADCDDNDASITPADLSTCDADLMPKAEAGPDQTVECADPDFTEVMLDGSSSSSPVGGELSYTWTGMFPEGGGEIGGVTPRVSLPIGANQLTLRVSNGYEESPPDTVIIEIVDTTPPIPFGVDPAATECSGPTGATVSLTATATDLCSPVVTITNDRTAGGADASGLYPLGTTTVGFTATDASGNVASCSSTVVVKDETAPAFSLAADTLELWPPNHRMVEVGVGWTVDDLCDGAPQVALTMVTSSEPDDAPDDGDGATSNDIGAWTQGTPQSSVMLRAERSGDGPGRIYQISYEATDASGNTAPGIAIVTVPHDQGSGPEPLLLQLRTNGAPDRAELFWPALPEAIGYDVISVNRARIVSLGDQTTFAAARVLLRGGNVTNVTEGAGDLMPLPGEAIIYFIQPRTAQGGTGYGTATAPWPRLAIVCDGGCP